MSKPCVPTLTTIGWATDPALKFDYAFADFMASNDSQSIEYQGSIASLPWIIQKTTGDRNALEKLSQRILEDHLEGLFDVVSVRTKVRENPKDESKLQLIFYITASQDGVAHNFVKAIENIDSKTLLLFDINNG